MTDPLTDIENRKAQVDLGTTAFRMYLGAREDGATRLEGLTVVIGWFRALLTHNQDNEDA